MRFFSSDDPVLRKTRVFVPIQTAVVSGGREWESHRVPAADLYSGQGRGFSLGELGRITFH